MGEPADARSGRPVFFFDVGSPWCWLAAELITGELGHAEWIPVLGSQLGPDAMPLGDLAELRRSVTAHRLQTLRLPERWPFDSSLAMRAATFAKQTGRTVAFSLAAMRQAYAAGRDLGEQDNVLIAAAACELHPRAVLAGVASRNVAAALESATADAKARGVRELPSVLLADGSMHSGPSASELGG